MAEMMAKVVSEMVKADLGEDCWDALTEEVYDRYEAMARAAIAAMREPGDLARTADDFETWQTMIDAALASPQSPGNGRVRE